MKLLQESIESIERISKTVDSLIKAIDGVDLTVPAVDAINNYSNKKLAIERALEGGEENRILEEIKHCAMFSSQLAQIIQNLGLSDLEKSHDLQKIIKDGRELKEKIKNRPAKLNLSEIKSQSPEGKSRFLYSVNVNDIEKRVEALSMEMERADERFRKDSNETIDRINVTSEKSKLLEKEVEENIKKAKEYYKTAASEVNTQRAKLNELIGEVSGDKVAKSYEESSKIEKRAADVLRIFSIVFMLSIAVIVIFTSWETTTENFKWENSAFRIVIAFFLTIPSAYLARESARHREQQYNHLQTSLTIRAIDPYISSLPEDIKHEIKKEISGHIFSDRGNSNNTAEAFPINNQEIIIELIKKLDAKPSCDIKPSKSSNAVGDKAAAGS
ncbi:hypothetical protein [Thalassolituus sp. UBA2590]|uniref:hypothetical protein n=1 Tax=Thalassolituus sp. UBA2590 TaxID=1947663 RepID=UPI0026470B42|nr:hypothetical protein [Thalassolituus sp. UBA2590]